MARIYGVRRRRVWWRRRLVMDLDLGRCRILGRRRRLRASLDLVWWHPRLLLPLCLAGSACFRLVLSRAVLLMEVRASLGIAIFSGAVGATVAQPTTPTSARLMRAMPPLVPSLAMAFFLPLPMVRSRLCPKEVRWRSSCGIRTSRSLEIGLVFQDGNDKLRVHKLINNTMYQFQETRQAVQFYLRNEEASKLVLEI